MKDFEGCGKPDCGPGCGSCGEPCNWDQRVVRGPRGLPGKPGTDGRDGRDAEPAIFDWPFTAQYDDAARTVTVGLDMAAICHLLSSCCAPACVAEGQP